MSSNEPTSQTTVRLCAAYHENGGCYPAWACDCIAIAEPDRHTVERLNAGLEATTPATSQTTEVVQIAGRLFTIDRVFLCGPDKPPFYGCGILPLRRLREDLLRDIKLSQGPEWRR